MQIPIKTIRHYLWSNAQDMVQINTITGEQKIYEENLTLLNPLRKQAKIEKSKKIQSVLMIASSSVIAPISFEKKYYKED